MRLKITNGHESDQGYVYSDGSTEQSVITNLLNRLEPKRARRKKGEDAPAEPIYDGELFVHLASGKPAISGTEVWVPDANDASTKVLAQTIGYAFANIIRGPSSVHGIDECHGCKFFDTAGDKPVFALKICYYSNDRDRKFFEDRIDQIVAMLKRIREGNVV